MGQDWALGLGGIVPEGLEVPRREDGPGPARTTRSPKLNGAVERANRTHTEEFFEVTGCPWTVEALNVEPCRWERTYSTLPREARLSLAPG